MRRQPPFPAVMVALVVTRVVLVLVEVPALAAPAEVPATPVQWATVAMVATAVPVSQAARASRGHPAALGVPVEPPRAESPVTAVTAEQVALVTTAAAPPVGSLLSQARPVATVVKVV